MSDDGEKTGACACGEIRYSLTGPLREIVACHCETCRRQSGHFVAATRVDVSALTVTAGQDRINWWEATPGYKRGFCKSCGSLLFWRGLDDERISIFAGSLDSPTGLSLNRHIFVAEKGDYYVINDSARSFEAGD